LKISAFSQAEFAKRLKGNGIYLRTGPFISHIRSSIPAVARNIHLLYAEHSLSDSEDFADFHIELFPAKGLRRWYRPQVIFSFDGYKPFKPLPLAQAFPMFEWTLNWCIANHSNQYLIMHAAAIEKNGFAAILPAPPGTGKSTLCAGLSSRGWRLLSDELAILRLSDMKLMPLARPINLKNDSINIMRQYTPDTLFGQVSRDTAKGDVAHMKPSTDSVIRSDEVAIPTWIIFPKYVANESISLLPRSKAQTFIYGAENSFNYSALGLEGFKAMEHLIDSCHCYDFTYSDLDQAIEQFNKLPVPEKVNEQ